MRLAASAGLVTGWPLSKGKTKLLHGEGEQVMEKGVFDASDDDDNDV
jgi:hypothetical protein